MSGSNHDLANADRPLPGVLSPWLARIPRVVRAAACYLMAHVFVLFLLPWSAYVLAERFLPWQIDIGWGRVAGWILLGACWLGYTISSVILVRRGEGAYIEFDPPAKFVASGPFRWCRNPIAGCILGMILGEALAFSSTGIFLLWLLVALPLAHLQVVVLEEPRLKKRFGHPYLDYLERVPRWLPRPPRREAP
jgi:protein-S-isoprenylcysteine O-methyltransferase Ste14